MKSGQQLLFALLIVTFSASSGTMVPGTAPAHVPALPPAAAGATTAAPAFADIPLYFVPNAGQFDGRVAFSAKTPSYTLWATADELVFDAVWREKTAGGPASGSEGDGVRPRPTRSPLPVKRDVSRLVFPGRNAAVTILPGSSSGHRVNYFLGDDPGRWQEGVETFDAVLYENLYPAVDLKVYGAERAVEYDWVVKPGGEVAAIRFEYRDVEETKIDQDGNLVVTTAFGDLLHKKPVAYQTAEGGRTPVDVRFKQLDTNAYGFEAGPYDPARALVIDPVVLVFSTFLGGDDWDRFGGIAVDKDRCVYVTGQTFSSNFPAKAAYDSSLDGYADIFVTKFNASGKGLVYSTFLGGPVSEGAYCLTVDQAENVYFGGYAYDGFPTKNAYDDSYDDSKHGDYFDAIIVKLNALGSLNYSTYLGKGDDDVVYAIAVDSAGRAHVGGQTDNSDFPLKYAFQPHYGGHDDAFVAVFSAAGNSLETSTFIGGNYPDSVTGLVLDANGYVYVCGSTSSSDFPTKNGFDLTFNGKGDAFYAKLGPRARSCVFSTLLGGGQWDYAQDIALDASGSAYIAGTTQSPNFPKKNAFDKVLGGSQDAFVAKFAPNGKSLVYSTFIGGSDDELAYDLALDGSNSACVVGRTQSSDFPCLGAYDDSYNGYFDAFLLKLSPSGKTLVFSTFLGGAMNDYAMGVCLDALGAVYVGGETYSSDFPVYKGFDMGFNGGEHDVFVAKFK